MNEVIKTKDYVNFCGGCNNNVSLQRFLALDEKQTIDDALEQRDKHKGDALFSRELFVGRCLCGNIFVADI